MTQGRDRSALSLGAIAGAVIAAASAVYAVILIIGLLSLPTPTSPIPDPWFTTLEILILLIAPSTVVLSIALRAWVPIANRSFGTIATAFFSMCCAITMSVHMTILAVAERSSRAGAEVAGLLFSFEWPSVVYALGILAWDLLFPVAAGAAALAMPRRTGRGIRTLLFSSSALSVAGLLGIPLEDMRVRNIGIVGYAVIFPVAAGMLAWRFGRCLRAA